MRLEDLIRAQRAVPSGPMDLIPDDHRAQERHPDGGVLRRPPEADAGRDLRHHGCTRTGDGCADHRRLFASVALICCAAKWASSSARGDGEAPRRPLTKAPARTGSQKTVDRVVRRHEKPAGYGFKQVALAAYALLAIRRRTSAPPHRSVHGRHMERGDERHRQGAATVEDPFANGLKFEAPDVNLCEYRFVPIDRKHHPLRSRRRQGHWRGAGDQILRARSEGGPFRILFDFCRRVNTQTVNRRTVEALIMPVRSTSCIRNRASAFASVVAAAPSERRARAGQCVAEQPVRRRAECGRYRWSTPDRGNCWNRSPREDRARGCTSAGTPRRLIAAICSQ